MTDEDYGKYIPDVTVLFEKLSYAAGELSYATVGSSGIDLPAAYPGVLGPSQACLVKTGFKIALPHRWEAQIRSRSGLAINHGVSVLNAPGTIDSDYRGEIMVILINHGARPFAWDAGDRIAQMVICRAYQAAIRFVEELPPTNRGEGGMGSTGT